MLFEIKKILRTKTFILIILMSLLVSFISIKKEENSNILEQHTLYSQKYLSYHAELTMGINKKINSIEYAKIIAKQGYIKKEQEKLFFSEDEMIYKNKAEKYYKSLVNLNNLYQKSQTTTNYSKKIREFTNSFRYFYNNYGGFTALDKVRNNLSYKDDLIFPVFDNEKSKDIDEIIFLENLADYYEKHNIDYISPLKSKATTNIVRKSIPIIFSPISIIIFIIIIMKSLFDEFYRNTKTFKKLVDVKSINEILNKLISANILFALYSLISFTFVIIFSFIISREFGSFLSPLISLTQSNGKLILRFTNLSTYLAKSSIITFIIFSFVFSLIMLISSIIKKETLINMITSITTLILLIFTFRKTPYAFYNPLSYLLFPQSIISKINPSSFISSYDKVLNLNTSFLLVYIFITIIFIFSTSYFYNKERKLNFKFNLEIPSFIPNKLASFEWKKQESNIKTISIFFSLLVLFIFVLVLLIETDKVTNNHILNNFERTYNLRANIPNQPSIKNSEIQNIRQKYQFADYKKLQELFEKYPSYKNQDIYQAYIFDKSYKTGKSSSFYEWVLQDINKEYNKESTFKFKYLEGQPKISDNYTNGRRSELSYQMSIALINEMKDKKIKPILNAGYIDSVYDINKSNYKSKVKQELSITSGLYFLYRGINFYHLALIFILAIPAYYRGGFEEEYIRGNAHLLFTSPRNRFKFFLDKLIIAIIRTIIIITALFIAIIFIANIFSGSINLDFPVIKYLNKVENIYEVKDFSYAFSVITIKKYLIESFFVIVSLAIYTITIITSATYIFKKFSIAAIIMSVIIALSYIFKKILYKSFLILLSPYSFFDIGSIIEGRTIALTGSKFFTTKYAVFSSLLMSVLIIIFVYIISNKRKET